LARVLQILIRKERMANMKIYLPQIVPSQASGQHATAVTQKKTRWVMHGRAKADDGGKAFGRRKQVGRNTGSVSSPAKTQPKLSGLGADGSVLFWVAFGWLYVILGMFRYARRAIAGKNSGKGAR
jgi:hypothetical protein